MRNLLKIATRLSFIISHSTLQHPGNCLSRKFATSQEKPQIRGSKKFGRHLSESVSKVIESIRLNRKTKIFKGNTLYLVDELAAKKFASLVIANRTENSSHFIEMNSGLGFLTTELLDSGVPSIHIFEAIMGFMPNIKSLSEKYQDRIHLDMVDFHSLWNIGFDDWKNNSDNLNNYFEHVMKRPWKEEPAMEIIGSLASINFIYYLISSVVHQNCLSKYGRVVLYAAVSPSVWETLTCTNEHYDLYRTRTILFQTLFRYKLLGSLPRTAFFPAYRPPPKKKQTKCKQKIRQNDRKIMHVVKIEANPDVFKDDFTLNDMMHFYYFVKHHLRARSGRVIPVLENWIPGCGRILIAQGYNIYTEFGELSPQEILKLFIEFRSWPEYQKSSFLSCVDSLFCRMDEQILLDGSSDEMENIYKLPVDQDESLIERDIRTQKYIHR